MNSQERLLNIDSGICISAIVNLEGKDEVVFIVKEDDKNLANIGKAPLVNIRGGVIRGDLSSAMLVMLKFNENDESYPLWFNYKSSYGKKTLECLQKQETILIECVDIHSESVFQFRVKNNINKLSINYIAISREYVTWEESDHLKLIEEMYKGNQYNLDIIWDTLGQQ